MLSQMLSLEAMCFKAGATGFHLMMEIVLQYTAVL